MALTSAVYIMSPTLALWGMLAKHIVSVHDMVMDAEVGQVPSPSMLNEKITDWINYGLLLEGLLIERIEEERPDYWFIYFPKAWKDKSNKEINEIRSLLEDKG